MPKQSGAMHLDLYAFFACLMLRLALQPVSLFLSVVSCLNLIEHVHLHTPPSTSTSTYYRSCLLLTPVVFVSSSDRGLC